MTGAADPGLAAALASIIERANVRACIECGRCTASCPAALPSRLRARAVVRAVQDGDASVVLSRDDIWHCTTCFSCQERCPKGVLVTQAVLWLRAEAARRGLHPAAHATALAELDRSGNVFPLDDEVRTARGQLGLPREPADAAHVPAEAASLRRLLDALRLRALAPPCRPPGGEGGGA